MLLKMMFFLVSQTNELIMDRPGFLRYKQVKATLKLARANHEYPIIDEPYVCRPTFEP